ncbi:hypothetical protein [Rhizobium sp. CC-YZS058]|uniref:hypothetical protein n=1 Tax=Rhizobium sp. CC-YZS058 TaxID=3042153 RepID=UPI002B05FDF4|nr:hypothetical protein [Rhizobium sp. CC-YZS058]MEA3533695.1 hypothetical protein [Rhizobium sp. CC-YZS058]
MTALASHHSAVIRDRLKDFVHGGKFFSSEDILALIKRMNTVVSLAEETEEENRILARQLAIAMQNRLPAVVGGNVVAFPGAHRGPCSIDGGDAA